MGLYKDQAHSTVETWHASEGAKRTVLAMVRIRKIGKGFLSVWTPPFFRGGVPDRSGC